MNSLSEYFFFPFFALENCYMKAIDTFVFKVYYLFCNCIIFFVPAFLRVLSSSWYYVMRFNSSGQWPVRNFLLHCSRRYTRLFWNLYGIRYLYSLTFTGLCLESTLKLHMTLLKPIWHSLSLCVNIHWTLS